ncbi:MAG: S-layer homology domain-containing protein [Oscillospiraceae bacterium]|nr:S-layer homology domain-containing protein [Oscillospiraceae bacterium]
MKKKALALVLVLCMALSMLPMTAFAAQSGMAVKTAPVELDKLAGALPGVSTQASYTVTLTGGSHGETELLVSSPAPAGSEVYFLANPDDGYLAEVYVSGIDPSEVYYMGFDVWGFVMPASKVTITVKYVAAAGSSHRITLNTARGGQAILDRTSAKEYESIYLAVLPDQQSIFIPEQHVSATSGDLYYLYEDGGVHYYELFMPDQDVTINVTFQLVYRPVTVTVETGLGGRAETNVSEAAAGDAVTVVCYPAEGYRVAQVTGVDGLVGNGDNTYSFTMPGEPVALKVLFLRHENPFLDINETQFYYTPVLWAAKNGITSGVDNTHFGPTGVCNRAQVVSFLWRAAGSPEPTLTENPFSDVPNGAWYTKAVLWAYENGITAGADDTHFDPAGVCNRAQVVTFLHRANGAPAPKLVVNPFTDVPNGVWYTAPILWALENGITSGTSTTTFNPGGQCLRAHVVTFLYNASKLPAA